MQILLIDDQGLIREALALHLRLLDQTFSVTSSGSVDDAREVIRRSPPDIIFLDISMGGDRSAGLDFLDELKDEGCDSRIIMISSEDEPANVGRAIASGAVGFISKNANDTSSMRRAIDIIVQGGVYISEELKNRRGLRPPASPRQVESPLQIREVGPHDLNITAARVYEVLWHISNGVRGYRNVARKMGISDSVAEEYARDGYSRLGIVGKDAFLVMLTQKGLKLKPPRTAKV